MPQEPEYPVATVGDGDVEIHRSFDSITRAIEQPEFGTVVVIDSRGDAFSLVLDDYDGLLERMFSFLGETRRCEMVPFSGDVPIDIIRSAEAALASAKIGTQRK